MSAARSLEKLARKVNSDSRRRPPPPLRAVGGERARGEAKEPGLTKAMDGLSATKVRQVLAFAEFLKTSGKPGGPGKDDDLSLLTTGFDLIATGSFDDERPRKLPKSRTLKRLLLGGATALALAALASAGADMMPTTAGESQAPQQAAPTQASAQPANVSVNITTYTVRPGDSLSGIAATVLGDPRAWPELQKLNHETLADPTQLEVGTVLRVPEIKE